MPARAFQPCPCGRRAGKMAHLLAGRRWPADKPLSVCSLWLGACPAELELLPGGDQLGGALGAGRGLVVLSSPVCHKCLTSCTCNKLASNPLAWLCTFCSPFSLSEEPAWRQGPWRVFFGVGGGEASRKLVQVPRTFGDISGLHKAGDLFFFESHPIPIFSCLETSSFVPSGLGNEPRGFHVLWLWWVSSRGAGGGRGGPEGAP